MTFDDYLLHLFYLIDTEYESLHLGRLRRRGPRPLAQVELTPADVSDSAAAAALVPPEGGVGIGDRNYWAPDRQAELAGRGLELLAPHENKSKDPTPRRSKLLTRFRRTIE